jgi:multidrug efflux pump
MIGALDKILRRPRAVLSLLVVLVVSGLFAYITIPKESNPDIQIPVVYVSVALPGISPEDSERLLVKPIETKLRGLEGLKQITAIASEGHAGIVVEFQTTVDVNKAILDVRDKVAQAKSSLPSDAKEPTVNEINFSLQPTILVAVSGNVPERTLYNRARDLQEAIEKIPSVLEARLTGQRDEVLEVIVDEAKLESYNLNQNEIFDAVARNNLLIAAGSVSGDSGRFSVKVPGLFEQPQDVFNLPIKTVNGTVVTLKDVAQIRRTFKDHEQYALYNGRPAITIEVVKRKGQNIIENNDEVKRVTEQLKAQWPDSIHISYALDESHVIKDVLQSLQDAVLLAIVLVMILVVAALGVRGGILVGISIPTSFLVGFLVIAMMGYTVNIMIMFGLILSVGILVDGAIVLAEYADRKMAEGVIAKEAYIAAAKRMFWPIVSSMATTIAAFLPLLFWPGIAGKFMSYLPVTVITVLAASLLTAMVFVPAVGFYIGKTDEETKKQFGHFADDEKADFRTMRGLTGFYLRFIERVIRHPAKVMIAVFGLMATIVVAFSMNSTGVKFFVDTEPEQVNVYVRARGNLSNEEKLYLVREVEARLARDPSIESIATYAGTVSGSAFGNQDVPADRIGQLQLQIKPVGQRPPWTQLQPEFEKKIAGIPGIITEVRELEGGPQSGKDIRLRITGTERQNVVDAALKIRDHMQHGMAGLQDFDDDLPLPGYEYDLKVNREEAARFGADILTAGTFAQLITTGALIGTYRPDDSRDDIDIRIRLPEQKRSLDELRTLKIQTNEGLVPLSNFMTIEPQPAVNVLYRENSQPSIYVKANVAKGLFANDKIAEINKWIGQQKWPEGLQFKFRGSDEDQQESFAFLIKAFLASVFMMFMILIVQYNSFYHSIITLSTVTMSTVGVLLGMLITRQYFSVIMTGTGIVALGGVVVSHSIVLIDTFHRLRDAGQHPVEAAIRTCAQRMRPVLLTSITAMLGLLPMVFQLNVNMFDRKVFIGSMTSAWWVHLSTAMVFGLMLATILTLILTPVMLAAPTVWREAARAKIDRWEKAKAARKGPVAVELPAPAPDDEEPPLREAAE